jgi:DNA-directed RNA polymerase specialized sigma24 family protein
METEEAARALGLKPASVRVRLHRARSALRDALGETS